MRFGRILAVSEFQNVYIFGTYWYITEFGSPQLSPSLSVWCGLIGTVMWRLMHWGNSQVRRVWDFVTSYFENSGGNHSARHTLLPCLVPTCSPKLFGSLAFFSFWSLRNGEFYIMEFSQFHWFSHKFRMDAFRFFSWFSSMNFGNSLAPGAKWPKRGESKIEAPQRCFLLYFELSFLRLWWVPIYSIMFS